MLFLSLFAFFSVAYADLVILDCNVQGGNQQVRVTEGGLGLELQELTSAGSWKSRSLSAKEWASRNLRLRADPGETYLLYFDAKAKAWFYQSVSASFRLSGQADCN